MPGGAHPPPIIFQGCRDGQTDKRTPNRNRTVRRDVRRGLKVPLPNNVCGQLTKKTTPGKYYVICNFRTNGQHVRTLSESVRFGCKIRSPQLETDIPIRPASGASPA